MGGQGASGGSSSGGANGGMGIGMDQQIIPNKGGTNQEAWQGFSGKYPPTDPKLPQGFEWLGPFSQNLAQGAASNVDYTGSNAAQAAGTLGSAATAATTAGTLPGTLQGFNQGLSGLTQGIGTGFLPDLNQLDAVLRPGLNRSFEEGSAAIREQSALTGNLSSTGATREISNYRGGLESNLNNAISGIYGNALPTAMGIQGDLTRTGLNMPAVNNQAIYNPAAQAGSQGFQNILGTIQTAMSAISGAPFYAKQGSSGNGALGALGAGMMSKGTGGGGQTGGGKG